MEPYPIALGRSEFSAVDRARAGGVWRALQEIAVHDAARRGFSGGVLRARGNFFVVHRMTVRHLREIAFGERLYAETWISSFAREVVCDREITISAEDGPVVRTTQQWVHVDRELRLARAAADVVGAFRSDGPTIDLGLPTVARVRSSGVLVTRIPILFQWMDPLNHVNHPLYIEWCDEALARVAWRCGVAPERVAPVAETVKFRSSLHAPGEVEVRTSVHGVDGDLLCFDHEIQRVGGEGASVARTWRRFPRGGAVRVAHAFGV